MPDAPLFSIGTLAARSGLSVRALRHYESVGLLPASARTAAGHRRYTAGDVERLQRIVSLRALGLPLAEIGHALGDADPLDLVERHLAAVRARIDAEQRLADRLAALADHLRHVGASSADDLLSLIRLTTMFEKHYTPEQLDRLRAQEATVGPERIETVHQEWAALFAEADEYRLAGLDPAGPEMQALARKAEALVGEFTGGDAGTRQSLTNAVKTDGPAIYAAWGIDAELGAFYSRAMAALHASRRSDESAG